MFRAGERMAGIDDLGLARNKTLQEVNLLVIDVLEVLRTEKALLGHGGKYHVSSVKCQAKKLYT